MTKFLLLLVAGLALATPVGASPVQEPAVVDTASTTEAADAPRVLLTEGVLPSASALASRYGVTGGRSVGHGWTSYRIRSGLDPAQVAAEIACEDRRAPCADADAIVQLPPMVTRAADMGQVKNAQKNYWPAALPNDPLLPQEWHLPAIGMETAWAYNDADAMRVAVLDTGIATGHPDLAPAIESGYDVVNGDTDPEDDNGHGTMVAGVVSAVCDNAIGVCGVGKGSTVISIKVFRNDGTARVSDLVKGVDMAASFGADVIVASWGYPTAAAALTAAIADAAAQGVTVIAAAGNDGQIYGPISPASDRNALSVGGLNRDMTRRATANQVGMQGIMAPGTEILTTSINGGYVVVDGASVAAPVVAGCALMVERQKLERTPKQIMDVLRWSARTMGPGVGANVATGWGALDCNAAMALEARSPIPTPTRTATPFATALGPVPPTQGPPAGTPTPWVITATPPVTPTPDMDGRVNTAVAATFTAVAATADARRATQAAIQAVKDSRQVLWLPVTLQLACRVAEPCPGWGRGP